MEEDSSLDSDRVHLDDCELDWPALPESSREALHGSGSITSSHSGISDVGDLAGGGHRAGREELTSIVASGAWNQLAGRVNKNRVSASFAITCPAHAKVDCLIVSPNETKQKRIPQRSIMTVSQDEHTEVVRVHLRPRRLGLHRLTVLVNKRPVFTHVSVLIASHSFCWFDVERGCILDTGTFFRTLGDGKDVKAPLAIMRLERMAPSDRDRRLIPRSPRRSHLHKHRHHRHGRSHVSKQLSEHQHPSAENVSRVSAPMRHVHFLHRTGHRRRRSRRHQKRRERRPRVDSVDVYERIDSTGEEKRQLPRHRAGAGAQLSGDSHELPPFPREKHARLSHDFKRPSEHERFSGDTREYTHARETHTGLPTPPPSSVPVLEERPAERLEGTAKTRQLAEQADRCQRWCNGPRRHAILQEYFDETRKTLRGERHALKETVWSRLQQEVAALQQEQRLVAAARALRKRHSREAQRREYQQLLHAADMRRTELCKNERRTATSLT
ncbi:MAG: hypothetical protein MHM6MM_004172 [Cercozoa sp. M6MM]